MTSPLNLQSSTNGSDGDALIAILEEKHPTLGALRRGDGGKEPTDVGKIIAAMLFSVQKRMQLPRMMDDATLDLVGHDIAIDYHWLKLEDIVLCLRRGCKGVYGETYQVFNQATVYKWLRLYTDERLDLAEKRSIKTASALKGTSLTQLTTKEILSEYKANSEAYQQSIADKHTLTAEELAAEAQRQREELAKQLLNEK